MMPELERRANVVALPAEFFEHVLPDIDDVAELKIALFIAWLAARQGKPAVRLARLLAPDVLRAVAGPTSPEPAERRLRQALNRAVANGVLLRLTVREGDSEEYSFLLATRDHRALIDRLVADDPRGRAELDLSPDAAISIYRPNVFSVYEQHIGPLTPLIAEQLRDAERSYPRGWIEQAILTAVNYNRRNWRYIQTVLIQWEQTGGPDGVPGRGA